MYIPYKSGRAANTVKKSMFWGELNIKCNSQKISFLKIRTKFSPGNRGFKNVGVRTL